MTGRPDSPAIAAVAALPAAALHEAMDQAGALPAAIRHVAGGRRLWGPAFPVATAPGDNLWLHRALALAGAGEVLVVATGGHREAGYWGELMTRAALHRGLAGLVVDGGVRDRAALDELAWPVFATGFCLHGTSKRRDAAGAAGEPVEIGGVRLARGDLVVGDGDGVVVVPGPEVAAVAARARERLAAEAEIAAALAVGRPLLDLLGLS